MPIVQLQVAKPLLSGGRHNCDGDEQRSNDRHGDCEGEIGEELAGFVFEKHHG